MVVPLFLSLFLFFIQACAQNSSNPYDRFYFPSSRSIPTYYNGDTLLVRYKLEKSGPAVDMILTLFCIIQSENHKASWAMDLNVDLNGPYTATIVARQGPVPSWAGTVPVKLPPLANMRMGDDGPPPACAFVLDGYIEELLSSVIVQSSTILIDYNETHEGKTYRSEGEGGEVPNRLYEVIDGDGTYDFYPGGLSTGAKAGIGAGVGVGVIGLLVLGFFFWWRRRRQKAKVAAAAGTASAQAQTPTEEKGGEEARTAELGGNHVSELEDKHNHPRHEMGPGVERAELGGDQMHHRFELPT